MKKALQFLVLLIFSGAPFLSHAQMEGMVAHWSFDNIENNQFKEHVSDQVMGTNYGAKIISGIKGKALEFNGVDSYVRIPGDEQSPPQSLRDLGEGSISLWFRVDTIPFINAINPIFYYGAFRPCENMFDASNQGMIIEVGHHPVHYNSERLYFTIFSNDCYLPSFCYDSYHGIKTGEWYHYVAVVGPDYNTGYLNGEEMTDRHYNFGSVSTSEFFEDALSHQTLWLGRGYWDAQEMYLEGAIDEVKIFDRALNQSEIEALYAEGNTATSKPVQSAPKDTHIYPNPAGNMLYLGDNTVAMKYVQIQDITTKNSYEKTIPDGSNFIDVSDLPQGIYLLQIMDSEKQLVSTKFMKR